MFTLLHIEETPYSYPAGAENEKNGTKLGNLSNSTNAPLREDNINKSMQLAAILIINALLFTSRSFRVTCRRNPLFFPPPGLKLTVTEQSLEI